MEKFTICIISYVLIMQCYANDDIIVNTTHGLVRGISEYVQGTKVDMFLGIPYATPPLQDLRFKDPVPHMPWNQTKDVTKYTPMCAMAGMKQGNGMEMSEDCLYLNIFVPEVFGGPIDGQPVAVLLGGLPADLRIQGSKLSVTESMMIDGSILAAIESIVVVTVNYRRDMFGFLATDDPESSGNYALKDQRLALQWVKDNAERFKGNAEQITLGGFLEGAAYVGMHMVNTASKALFGRAFMTSIVSPYSDAARKHYPGGGPAKRFSSELADRVDCGSSNDFINCLQGVETMELIDASVKLYEEEYKETGGYWMFTDRVDGNFLPKDISTMWDEGYYDNIPLLVSGEQIPMESDMKDVLPINESDYRDSIQRLISPMPWEVPSQTNFYSQPLVETTMYTYNNWTTGMNGQSMAQQIIKMNIDRRLAGQNQMLSVYTENLNSDTDNKAFRYIFDYKSSLLDTDGVQMGDDVLYILGEPLRSDQSWTLNDEQVSRLMMAFFGNFISHGDPTHRSGISWWPAFESNVQSYLRVNREGGSDIREKYRQEKMSFWNELRPSVLSAMKNLVVQVKENPQKYDLYLNSHNNAGQNSGNSNNANGNDDDGNDDDDDDIDKYLIATYCLAGLSIILAIGIVVLLWLTYKTKADKKYNFEATKL